jgi:predicted metal-dependent phosphoesterase TrpH
MHIVGLFIDVAHAGFREFLGKLSEGRRIRNPKILAKLAEHGVDISMEEVEEAAGLNSGGGGAIDKSVGRPHIAGVMIKKGYVKDKTEAFDKYLAKGQSCYVSRFVASPEETIRQIHTANGLAILAHPPYLKASSEEELESLVGGLKDHGLDGIEVHYSTHTKQQTEMCARLARKFDLVPSGGSDFHGEPGSDGQSAVELGFGIRSNLRVPYAIFAGLRERWSRGRVSGER